MARKLKKGDTLKIGDVYGYVQEDNEFKVLALYDSYAWIIWQNFEIETLYLEPSTLKEIFIIEQVK